MLIIIRYFVNYIVITFDNKKTLLTNHNIFNNYRELCIPAADFFFLFFYVRSRIG